MRIGIDARMCGKGARGIGRYTLNLITQLENLGSGNEYVVFMNKESSDSWKPSNSSWKKVLVDIPWYSLAEQRYMSKEIAKENIDVMHFPHYNVPVFYNKPYVVTIHDLLLHRHKTSNATTRNTVVFYLKYIAYHIVFKRAISRAQSIIAVSEFTKKEILSYYPTLKTDIKVIYEGLPIKTVISGNEYTNSLLYVGAVYPHKNVQETIREIYPMLEKYNATFTLVGKNDYFYQQLIAWCTKEKYTRIVFSGELSDEKIGELYARSKAMLFPSRYEGFGLPPLEALMSSCPVIAYASEGVKEISGEYIHLYRTSTELLKLVSRILQNEKEYIAESVYKEIIERYSWLDMAKNTESLYTIVHGHKGET